MRYVVVYKTVNQPEGRIAFGSMEQALHVREFLLRNLIGVESVTILSLPDDELAGWRA